MDSTLNRRSSTFQGSFRVLGTGLGSFANERKGREPRSLDEGIRSRSSHRQKNFRISQQHSRLHRLGDFAISPYKPVPSRKYSAPIKNVGVLVTWAPCSHHQNIADDSKIIADNEIGAVLENLHTEDYRSAVITIDRLLNTFTIRQLYDKIRPIVESNRNFGVARKVYEGIYS